MLSLFRRGFGSTKAGRGLAAIVLCAAVLAACGGGGAPSGGGGGTPAPPPADPLIAVAATFPAMPKDLAGLLALRPGSGTFGSGTPYNDLEYTAFDTDYMEGETNGFDTFLPVDPGLTFPGADQIKIINGVNNLDLNAAYNGPQGDRVILGTFEIAQPFFLRGPDGADNDYAVLTNFDYRNGYIQLQGRAEDYRVILCSTAQGCRTTGFYLFYVAGSQPDLVAFVFRCDDLALPISGAAPRDPKALCNATEALDLANASQFRFATPIGTQAALPSARAQFGGPGREIVGGVALDENGAVYAVGLSDSNLDGGATGNNEIFAARFDPSGARTWVRELVLPDGSLLFDAAADDQFLYAVGRTLGALEGFSNRGRWDAIILKIRLSDGTIIARQQFGNEGLDGFGNVVLDDAGNLYVSGAGSEAGSTGTDSNHLVAKYRASDLGLIWTQIVPPITSDRVFVAEAWGGLSYIPGAAPGDGRLVAGGWFMTAGGANGFLEVWERLTTTAPQRVASAVVASPNNQADWVLDNAVDAQGNIYAVGYTTGVLGDSQRSLGDAYIVRFDPNLRNPVFRQVGTPQNDMFRRMRFAPDGDLVAVGYSYGGYAGLNADRSNQSGDVILQRFRPDLTVGASRQIGTPHEDRAVFDIRDGRLAVAGTTEGALAARSLGSFDGYVLDLDPVTLR